jgi:hypothetical protein
LQPKVNQLGCAYGIKSKDASGKLVYDDGANKENPFEGVLSASLESHTGTDAVAESLESNADFLLFDLPGGKAGGLKEVFGKLSTLISEMESSGYEIVVVLVMSYLKASAVEVGEVVSLWGPTAKYVVVLNLGLADRDQFIFFDGDRSDQCGYPAKLLAKAGGVVVEMQGLQPQVYAELDADEARFSDAVTDTESYKRATRVRIREWLEIMDSEISKIGLIDYSPEMLSAFALANKLKHAN